MKDIYEKRLLRVREGMKKRDLAQLLVSDPPALAWLTGEDFDPGERLAVLVIDIEGGVRWVRNGLFPVIRGNALPSSSSTSKAASGGCGTDSFP